MKEHNEGRTNTTITALHNQLLHLQRNTDLNNPEAVKDFIANKSVSDSTKLKLCLAYNKYAKYYQITWTIPKYHPIEKMPKIPTEKQVNTLIAGAGKILSLKLWLTKETGIRPCELHDLKVKDIDTEHDAIIPTTHKRGCPRTLKIPTNLKQALQQHIINNGLQPNVKLFRSNPRHFGNDYRQMRNTLSKKLNDPALRTVRLYDFRHFYGTMRYWKLRDVPLTAEDMGHKDYNTTRKYLHLVRILELMSEDGWICKTAQTPEEIKALIEAGYEKMDEKDGIKYYRKRK